MTQYINKVTVIAEIDKLINLLRKSCNSNPLGTMVECLTDAQIEALSIVKESIENIKEVDLEKEISEYFVEHPDEFFSDKYKLIAKHFFELGIQQLKKTIININV